MNKEIRVDKELFDKLEPLLEKIKSKEGLTREDVKNLDKDVVEKICFMGWGFSIKSLIYDSLKALIATKDFYSKLDVSIPIGFDSLASNIAKSENGFKMDILMPTQIKSKNEGITPIVGLDIFLNDVHLSRGIFYGDEKTKKPGISIKLIK